MQLKRVVYFLLINLIVSASTTLVVLSLWDRAHNAKTPDQAVPQLAIPTLSQGIATQVVVPRVEATANTISLQTYQVSPGETLGEIALAFEITVEELLEINGLSDPNSIGTGATIFVPVRSDSLMSGEPAGSPSEMNSEEPVSPGDGGQVRIVAVIGAGDLASERVQIQGMGEDVTLSLTEWRLQDEDGNRYTFPQITLFGNGAVDIYSTAGIDTVVALYWNVGMSVWEPGETVTLFDKTGNIQSTYTIP